MSIISTSWANLIYAIEYIDMMLGCSCQSPTTPLCVGYDSTRSEQPNSSPSPDQAHPSMLTEHDIIVHSYHQPSLSSIVGGTAKAPWGTYLDSNKSGKCRWLFLGCVLRCKHREQVSCKQPLFGGGRGGRYYRPLLSFSLFLLLSFRFCFFNL